MASRDPAHTAGDGQGNPALADIDAAQRWRCFHCDEEFTDRESAADHFGKYERDCDPICTVGAARYRDLEHQLAIFRAIDGTFWRWNPFRSDFNQHFPEVDQCGCGSIDCVNECDGDFTHATCPNALSAAAKATADGTGRDPSPPMTAGQVPGIIKETPSPINPRAPQ